MAYVKCIRNLISSAVPDGKTVTPTDDISIWLACGGRSETYTTLSQVLADSTCLNALINDNNAVDYLVRSTTWASDICGDSSAMSYIGLNNYASNTLLADSTWCSAICNSTYFESVLNVKVPTMTSNTTPSGECFGSSNTAQSQFYQAFNSNESDTWSAASGATNNYIGYTFDSSVDIYKTDLIYRIQGSTPARTLTIQHGASNTDIDTLSIPADSGTSALRNISKVFSSKVNDSKFRLFTVNTLYSSGSWYIQIAELQFYGRADI